MEKEIKEGLVREGYEVKGRSYREIEGEPLLLLRKGEEKKILLGQRLKGKKQGKKWKNWFILPFSFSLYKQLQKKLPFLTPHPFPYKSSFGFGDRLGISTSAQIASFEGMDIFPVLAQQSFRELERMGRSLEEVLASAGWGVLEEGFQGRWGADADHIKTMEQVKEAIKTGFSIFTLDLSPYLNPRDEPPLVWKKIKGDFLGKEYNFSDFKVSLGEKILESIIRTYWKGLDFVVKVFHFLRSRLPAFSIEISLDETGIPTEPEAHFFLVSYLRNRGVDISGLAICFPGRFEKGVDYKGDKREFAEYFRRHSLLARSLDGYRLSVHSGSDKFSLYPLMKPWAPFHVKTSGTTWLEAIFTLGEVNFPLFVEIFNLARKVYLEESRSYSVSASPERIPSLKEMEKKFKEISRNSDLRQILHVTYGPVWKSFRKDILATLNQCQDIFRERISRHLRRHLEFLYG